ncbi:MAG: hypothetical protein IIC79_06690, partial [Chloroflexi bacterium]|nr:hypothetical protein [Chloroflexota bacterium]
GLVAAFDPEVIKARQSEISSAQAVPVGQISRTTNTSIINRIEPKFIINTENLSEEQAVAAVESGVEKALSVMIRATDRDVNPLVER